MRTICKKRNHGNLKESGADQDPLNKVEISILEFKCISSKFSRQTSSRFIFREYSENHSGWSEDKKQWCCLEVGSTGTQRISPDPSRTSRTTVAPVAWGSPRPMALHGSAWLCQVNRGCDPFDCQDRDRATELQLSERFWGHGTPFLSSTNDGEVFRGNGNMVPFIIPII